MTARCCYHTAHYSASTQLHRTTPLQYITTPLPRCAIHLQYIISRRITRHYFASPLRYLTALGNTLTISNIASTLHYNTFTSLHSALPNFTVLYRYSTLHHKATTIRNYTITTHNHTSPCNYPTKPLRYQTSLNDTLTTTNSTQPYYMYTNETSTVKHILYLIRFYIGTLQCFLRGMPSSLHY